MRSTRIGASRREFDYADFGSRDFAMNGERNPYVAKIRNDQDLVKLGGDYRF